MAIEWDESLQAFTSPSSLISTVNAGDVPAKLWNESSQVFTSPSSLITAVKAGDVPVMTRLFEAKADPNCMITTGSGGYNVLHWAAWKSTPEVVIALLEAKADINALTGSKSTALHWASYERQHAIVDILLRRGAAVDVTNNFSHTAYGDGAKDENVKRVYETFAFEVVCQLNSHMSAMPEGVVGVILEYHLPSFLVNPALKRYRVPSAAGSDTGTAVEPAQKGSRADKPS